MRPPALDPGDGRPSGPPVLLIPEIRDYQRINAELKVLLDAGHRHLKLEGAEGQRLLVSRLVGPWTALVEVAGTTGPEFASELDAPGLLVVGTGSTSDGLARGNRAGTVIILGDSGDAAGAGQTGGLVLISGSSGHRAGLGQAGGTLAFLGPVGRLAGDRQSGGYLFARRGMVGPYPGRGRRGGRLIELPSEATLVGDDSRAWGEVVAVGSAWIDPATLPAG